ncbi:MAG TPA: hypothetical protein VJZ71_05775 [Phycisphaerae bacterium]|nr:hypothetical protein [Phycisphaerae bacterium]
MNSTAPSTSPASYVGVRAERAAHTMVIVGRELPMLALLALLGIAALIDAIVHRERTSS